MSRRLLLALAVALVAAAPTQAAAPAGSPDAAALTLRLADLDPGYVLVGNRCDAVASTSATRLPRRSCDIAFEPAWAPRGASPGPALVVSAAFVYPDVGHAQQALSHPRATVGEAVGMTRDTPELVERGSAIGEETVLLREQTSVGYVLWRSGSIVGLVWVSGGHREGPLDAAVRLAAAQQARIATPTPLLPSDLDDVEVPLADPRVDVPIFWVGRSFDGGPRLPRVHLQVVDPLSRFDRRTGLRAMLIYGPRDGVTAFRLGIFAPSAFTRRPLRRELGRIRRDRCVTAERIRLTNGSATRYAPRRGCPAALLDGPVALVRLPGVRVAVIPDYGCADCTDVVTRYASAAGVRAVIRALRLRVPTATTDGG